MSVDKEITYEFLPQLFLRAPYYSFGGYDLSRLPEVLQEQAFRNAVWLASPEFYRVLEHKDFDFDRLKDKERHTLSKYYNRMCFRPTPFGSFASFTLLEWGNADQVKLVANDRALLHLQPDGRLLYQLRDQPYPDLTGKKVTLNPTLYRFANDFRYTKSTLNAKGRYEFSLESISAVKFHIRLFAFIGSSCLPLDDVNSWIIKNGDCTENDALDYIRFLLDAQVLFSDDRASLISLGSLGTGLKIPGWEDFWKTRRSILMSSAFNLDSVADELEHGTSGKTTFLAGQPFYASLERPVDGGGPEHRKQAELLESVRVLRLLSVYGQPEDLTRFIRNFRGRFDKEKVPFLVALDPDGGLPYGDLDAGGQQPGVLENLLFPVADNENSRLAWNAVQQLIFRLWIGDTLRDPWSTLQIGEKEVSELESRITKSLPPPQTLALMYRDTGEHLIIESAGGATGAALVGRFSVFSPEVHALCTELADREIAANPDVIFADIGQLSDLHVDNVNRRQPVYPNEIPINVFPGQVEDHTIRPGDLMLSVDGDKLILESVRLGKRVIPRLTTAYNFRNNHLPAFRLLCDLQFQGIQADLVFDLESLFPGLSYYPRVACRRTIFSLARWIFTEKELSLLTNEDVTSALEALQVLRKDFHIPRLISLGAHDQQLVFDLAQRSEAVFFLQCISGRKKITLTEYLPPDRSVLAGKKPLAGQMIAFLSHGARICELSPTNDNELVAGFRYRSFRLGSEWLYLKIFCIPRAADTIIAKVILPFLRSHRERIQNWFFIRFTDKGYHLRLRIRADQDDLGILLVALQNKMRSGGYDKLIREYQGDTYHREMERYGLLIAPVEDLFRSGSDLVAWFIAARLNEKCKRNEFEFAILTANRMIACFLPLPENQLIFLNRMSDSFMTEFRADKQLRTGMDTTYRELKTSIHELLVAPLKLKQFSTLIKELENLKVLTTAYPPDQSTALLADLVHMQLNRTFGVQQREQEMLVYYCLLKYTTSLAARQRSFVHSP